MITHRDRPLPAHWRILAVDLDGTLIGWNHKINDRDLEALRRARTAGFHVALCTGRNAKECAGIISALNFPAPTGPGVFVNGAMIADMATGQTLHAQILPFPLVEEATHFLGSPAATPSCSSPTTPPPASSPFS